MLAFERDSAQPVPGFNASVFELYAAVIDDKEISERKRYYGQPHVPKFRYK